MPSSDYSNTVGGGLKLKGAGGVDKKKKKKKAKKEDPEEHTSKQDTNPNNTNSAQTALQKALAEEEEEDSGKATSGLPGADVKEYGKTEAQRRFEERRKKRLDERLQKEGVKTHKERVEQLNKYLSTLSEHNDMPRIGPG